ncbi:glycosyltransferase [Paenibacillus melissococcoides]|uniref:Glycosyltransferase n=1 Tax=Paenibacillus melissococcoides TaxID=2912268 RepID=A0ABM9GBS2_9BACL|nr:MULTISPECIES: glycosyltransferase [Paenibacillus]MEB9894631.1 glycosyltransferase [Bacillus cereus]CAH8248893.1 glycosyltransferase [Paenibacillus melissococcoides]CAH8720711.1 glycosyltransferase [Paenibacillus melissococcoides]CAH8720929.1 glycosyltransferase [Paenibacillus melissococcoides]GIO79225.1 glycosyl transferase family protein [Paenibacillus dendritiformis]
MEVSAVIPVFNGEAYIVDAIDSLLHQTSKLKEIIVIDDHSTDKTSTVVQNMISNSLIPIKYIRNSVNRGVSFSRNLGIREAIGDWIMFLDADDKVDIHLLEYQRFYYRKMKEAQPDSNWILVHNAFWQVDESGKRIGVPFEFRQVEESEILGYQFLRNYVYLSGTLANKEAMLNVGAFNPELKLQEDWDLWLKLAQLGGFVYVPEPLVYIRRHECNTSNHVESLTSSEKNILKQYSLDLIKSSIMSRKLEPEQNLADFVGLLMRLEKWQEASQEIHLLLKKGSKLPTVHFLHGLLLLENEDLTGAEQAFKTVLKYNPDHGATLNNLGVLYLCRGDMIEAEKYFSAAIHLFPGYLDATHNLNVALQSSTVDIGNLRITKRELRKNLLRYKS